MNNNLQTVESTRFGKLEYDTKTIIKIPEGIIGFSNEKDFIMIEHKYPFSWLQSITNPKLAFIVIDGSFLSDIYDIEILKKNIHCEIQEDDEYAILLVVTIRGQLSSCTVNTKAPIFINLKNRTGAQIIFDLIDLSVRTPILELIPSAEIYEEIEKNNEKKEDMKE